MGNSQYWPKRKNLIPEETEGMFQPFLDADPAVEVYEKAKWFREQQIDTLLSRAENGTGVPAEDQAWFRLLEPKALADFAGTRFAAEVLVYAGRMWAAWGEREKAKDYWFRAIRAGHREDGSVYGAVQYLLDAGVSDPIGDALGVA